MDPLWRVYVIGSGVHKYYLHIFRFSVPILKDMYLHIVARPSKTTLKKHY